MINENRTTLTRAERKMTFENGQVIAILAQLLALILLYRRSTVRVLHFRLPAVREVAFPHVSDSPTTDKSTLKTSQ